MLSRLRIGPKLLLAPGVVLVLLVLLSCGAYRAMVRQNGSLDLIVQERAARMRAAAELVASSQRAQTGAYQVLAWVSGSFPSRRVEPLVREVRVQHAAVERALAILQRDTAANPQELRFVEGARDAWRVYVPAVEDVMDLARHDQSVSASAMSKAERAFGMVAQRLTELALHEQALSERASSDAAQDVKLAATLMPVVIVLSIAAVLAITMAVRRALLAELGAIEAAASGLASGDLTIRPRVYGNDELAATSRALDAGIRNLNGNLRTILESARSIGSSSRDIALHRAGLPARAGVREAVERTSASMQELAGAMRGAADGAEAARRLASSAALAAEQGGDTVHRLLTTMENVRRSAQRLDEIGAAIDTTLDRAGRVALEAAVRAAQAGEQGADFAAAACELRSLARQAGVSAQEARALARQAVATIEHGSVCAVQAGASMADLAGSVQAVDDIVERIGCASAERASDLDGIDQAIVRMDEMTRQGTRMVEEAALAARTLQQQALTLSRAVSAFRLDEAVLAAPDGGHEKAPPGTHDLRDGGARPPYLRLASSRGGIHSK
jgi:methyl-accepting chemotaxis protein